MKNYLKLFSIILLPFLIGISIPEKKPVFIFDETGELNPERLDGPFTGGFGEQTCHSCHFDYDINMEGGRLVVQGIGESYRRGESYEVTVTIESEHLEIGGFQMTSRFKDGSQAGRFLWEGEKLMLTPSISDDVQYLQHSAAGTRPTGKLEVSWSFMWEAPENRTDDVVFNIAANAGNDDDSAFGDRIYMKELVVQCCPTH